ncbi:MAG: hypothetical protein ACRD2A_13050, partial [Vicinamibacterales bacterium]
MSARRSANPWIVLATALLLPLATSCSDDEATGPGADPLVGTWQVTSFSVDGTNLIASGMTMRITLTAAKTYTLVVTNDLVGTCDPATAC